MAGQTVREHLQLLPVVRLAVTSSAGRDAAVLFMTSDTGHLTVLAWRLLPFCIHFTMTVIAGLQGQGVREVDLQRCMNAFMTSLAVFGRLCLVMAIVTLRAIRNISVPVMMTALTAQLGMHAGEPGQLLFRTGMAVCAGLSQSLHGRDLQRSMRILVTAEAICLLWPVLLAMAGCTERHQLGIVVFTRIIGVEDLVALLAGKTMSATSGFQVLKLIRVALTALCGTQRCGRLAVEGGINLRQLALGGRNRPWLENSSQGDNTNSNKNNFKFQDLISSVYFVGQLFRS